jgi:hypothetical protein
VFADEGSQTMFCPWRLNGPETLAEGGGQRSRESTVRRQGSAEHNAPILCAAGAQHIVLARPQPPIGAVHPSHCIEAQPYTLTRRTLRSPCSRLTASTTSSQEDVTRIPGIWAGKRVDEPCRRHLGGTTRSAWRARLLLGESRVAETSVRPPFGLTHLARRATFLHAWPSCAVDGI